uniref:NocB n=1 Tax=Nocardia sp. ATCC 202099 TaxID=930400 RepID=E5DUG3_9NOCA|nr:NocB [Nocardia sp. ATCC 202099]
MTRADAATYPFPVRCPFTLPDELERLSREEPVAPVRLPTGAPAWLVSGHEQVRTVLADERFSRRPARERAAKPGGGGFDFGLAIADPADHERWRRLVGQVLNPRHAESVRPAVRELAGAAVGRLADRGGPVDFMAEFAFRLPLDVLCALYAVPADLRPAFDAWAAGLRGAAGSMEAFGAAMRTLHDAARELVARKPADGVLPALAEVRGPDGDRLSETELVSTVVLLSIAGYETGAVQFGNGLLALFQHPDQLARLAAGEVDIAAAVEEVLRYAQAGTGFAGMTYTSADVDLGGTTIPAHAQVLISLDAAGRDPGRVERPHEFDLARGAAGGHLSFGSGRHYCLGAPLARVELQEGFAALVRGLPGLRAAVRPDEVVMGRTMFSFYPAELPTTWAFERTDAR